MNFWYDLKNLKKMFVFLFVLPLSFLCLATSPFRVVKMIIHCKTRRLISMADFTVHSLLRND